MENCKKDGVEIELFGSFIRCHIAGELYREDGPAVEKASGIKQWYLNGRIFESKEDWFEKLPEDSKMKTLFNESFIKR